MNDWRKPSERQARIVRYEDGAMRCESGTIEEVREKAQDGIEEHGPIAVIA